jgi:hypothetical protein
LAKISYRRGDHFGNESLSESILCNALYLP